MNLYTEHRLINFASRNLKARIASTRDRRAKGRANVAKRKATARGTARTAKPAVNPRSSAGQAGARRPTGVTGKQTFTQSIGNRNTGDRDRDARFAATPKSTIDLNRGMGSSKAGTSTGSRFDTIADAEAQAQDERVRTGTVTPETLAAIEKFKDPSLVSQGTQSGQEAKAEAQAEAGAQNRRTERAPAGAPLEDPRSGAGGQLGELGISEGTFSGQIRDLTARKNETMMVQTGSGQSVVDTEGMKFRNENIDAEIRQIERQIRDEQTSEAQAEATRAETRKGEVVATPESAGAGAAFANLPPEAQFLAPFLQEFQQSMQQSLQDSAQLTQDLSDKQTASTDAIDSQLSDMQQAYKTSAEAMQGILEEVTEQTDKNIAVQQKSAEEKISWQEMKLRRDITKQKREAHDTLIAQIALNNGFAQDAGTTAVLKSDAEFDSRMQELAETMTFARKDLAAQFSGLYMENQNNYVNATVSNTKDLLSSMERLGMAGIQNQQAKQTAEQNLLTSAWERQVGLRDKLAKGNLDIAKYMVDIVQTENELNRKYDDAILIKQEKSSEKAEGKIDKAYDKSRSSMLTEMNRLSTRMNNDPILKPYNMQKMKWATIDEQYKKTMADYELFKNGEKDEISMNWVDQGLINGINKMWDESSVVRETEYDRSPAGMSLENQLSAWVSRLTKGGVLNQDEREYVKESMDSMFGVWEAAANDSILKFDSQLNQVNSTLHPDHWLQQEDFGLTTFTDRFGEKEESPYNSDWVNSTIYNLTPSAGGDDLRSGRLTQVFDTPITSKSEGGLYETSTVQKWGGKHAGIDIAMRQNSDVKSSYSGKVIEANFVPGYGGTIVFIDSYGAEQRVSHLSSLNVKVGDEINKGDVIALSGGTPGTKGAGNSTGAHVDWRIRKNGKYIDPLTYQL